MPVDMCAWPALYARNAHRMCVHLCYVLQQEVADSEREHKEEMEAHMFINVKVC